MFTIRVIPVSLTIPLALAAAGCLTGAAPTEGSRGAIAGGSHDECEEHGWYGDTECDTFCQQRDPDCATDERTPELGDDPSVVLDANITMGAALAQVESAVGPTIEAKYELDGAGALSLSVYPLGQPAGVDAERNLFQEAAGDPIATPWAPGLEVFHDQEHLTRSARELTLLQLSRVTLRDVVAAAEQLGTVYWAIPTVQEGRAGFGVYLLDDDGASQYFFVDGQGSSRRQTRDLGTGPGANATDQRVPELGDDLTVVRQSRISMSDALRAVEREHGPSIEAKFELDHDGHLSLSIYPVGKGIDVDPERNTFFELAGDPTLATFAPESTEFTVPDEEHLTRSARDLTLVQTARMSLRDAVQRAERSFRGAFVYWAIPTIRDSRAGYGVYLLDRSNRVHYLFIS